MTRPEEYGEVVPLRRGATGPAEPDGLREKRNSADFTESNDEPDEVVDAELVTTPVDPEPTRPTVADRVAFEARYRPVLPAAVADRETRIAAERWFAARMLHAAAFHGVRLPWYVAQAVGFIPGGAARVLRGLAGWAVDAEAVQLRRSALHVDDAATWQKLERDRADRVRPRRVLLALGTLAAVAGAAALRFAPPWASWAVVAALLVGLAYLGRPRTRPWIGRAVDIPEAPKLTSETVTRALGALGIAELRKAAEKETGIEFPAPICRDGAGWRATVTLPYGVTAADVIERRDRLASGLRRPLGAVWPESAGEDHPGQLVLWVGDVDLAKARQPAWPLARKGEASLFEACPFGCDPRGRAVGVELMYSNLLVGSLPGAGKSMAMRLPLLFAALDPTAELHLAELKGTGDLSPLEPVAHRYVSGIDDDSVEEALDVMRGVYAELGRRAKVISGLPKDLAPENKVTAQLAAKRSLGLHPLVLAIDEAQEIFSHPEFGAEADKLATGLVKRGRALGVIALFSTQRPDAKSLPTGVSANTGTRFCLRVMGQTENDMVLGTSMYKNGYRATMFSRRDLGVGWLVGASDDPQICRTYLVDQVAAERIVARARAAREEAGTLAGHAVGEAPDRAPAVDLLDDTRVVFATAERLWNADTVAGLAQLRPDVYAGWTVEMFAAAMRQRYGIESRQTWIDGRNRQGIQLAQLHAVLENRDAVPALGAPSGDTDRS
ncbi:MAG: cell division protein FtsK [Pseudonocardiaceae bacterium]|nr:cell division protein FtsK [Pseudonocardiaceae bacterium]